ncbi:MAG: methylenetetrahydrofolate--tRNA-(uracil(54)-C(5))-methyltransferase (FADH(2)-oxidizing) TrmFO [Deltaproteobacteria bacterium]|jgi:methylenetetrahydrofolate--tRNA-(uracil-5-)-methyltransferase|nr:methylenetetrahydrofolate--tRNA-(uracil(54)-C(5))-methyltransferase (FADH(2)-oxidizing) TrmFO [Deltaproteobacteria bacterium]
MADGQPTDLGKGSAAAVVTVIGGGLAGCEAAAMAATVAAKAPAEGGLAVRLFEMKPECFSPAHTSPHLAELVCSNSFRSDDPDSAVGLLKAEMKLLGSLTMAAADSCRVPAGGALAVDRERFGETVDRLIAENPRIELIRAKAERPFDPALAKDGPVVVATGPLAGPETTGPLAELAGGGNLHFYDALAPIVTRDSLDPDKFFAADRYAQGPGSYLNCPLSQDEFEAFLAALLAADRVRARPFEEERYFEGCLPIEVMAARGPRTLTFGPMKPVGLVDPRTGQRPAAVVQLRPENLAGTHYNLVGFQTRMTVGAQEEVFRLIPALKKAKFARHGAIHRNTYVDAPRFLDPFQGIPALPGFFLAGQITGVEGYVESAAQGLWVGLNAARTALGRRPVLPPRVSALGSLLARLGPNDGQKPFCPSNVNFGLFPPPSPNLPKRQWSLERLERARSCWEPFLKEIDHAPAPRP